MLDDHREKTEESPKERAELQEHADLASAHLENAFAFARESWGEKQELLIMVSELTANSWTARFIGRFGCDSYYRYSKPLNFSERHAEIMREISSLGLE